MEGAIKERAECLHRMAEIEIARHAEREPLLGAALDGSLATGAVWPTSDLDFTIVPEPGRLRRDWVEWGERDGIPWHKHVSLRRTLLELMEGYPDSFACRAEGEFNLDANWLLDGMAVMEVVHDPTGLLAEVKAFVSERRFAADVWDRRRAAFLAEMRRVLSSAQESREKGEPAAALDARGGGAGFSSLAAQVWLEGARRIYSGKEQDGAFAEAARKAGRPEAHALYRTVLEADPRRAEAASPLLHAFGEAAAAFFEGAGALAQADHPIREESRINAAWTRHLARTLSISPRMGHPAGTYQRLGMLRWWAVDLPERWVPRFHEAEIPGADDLEAQAAALNRRLEQIEAALYGEAPKETRAESVLQAAERLLDVTESAVR